MQKKTLREASLSPGFRERLFNLMAWLLIFVLILLVCIGSAGGYGGSYNKRSKAINITGHWGVNEYIFLHEQGHAYWHEHATWQEKALFKFRAEYFANVYGASFECRVKDTGDDRIKKIFYWLT